MVVLSSCSRHYKYQVVHTNNRVEVISIIGDDLVINDKLILTNKCNCDEFAYDVKSFSYISLDDDYNKKADRNIKRIILIFISIVNFMILFLIIYSYWLNNDKFNGKYYSIESSYNGCKSCDFHEKGTCTRYIEDINKCKKGYRRDNIFIESEPNKLQIFLNKNKSMTKIIKYILFGGIIILLVKIMVILIKYLPGIIETHLK